MRLRRTVLLFLTPVLAVLACGGRVDGINPERCPAPDQVNDSSACAVEGLTCSSSQAAVDPCTGQPTGQLQCSCAGGTWSCNAAYTCEKPPPECPPMDAVRDGIACRSAGLTCPSGQSYTDCDGVLHDIQCTCGGPQNGLGWQCESVPMCAPDSGPPPPPPSCPDPSTVPGNGQCSQDGQQCPGNPQDCGGTTFYDAFQCEGGKWVDIAPTVCDADAGTDAGGGG
jgi:hypothetical protein